MHTLVLDLHGGLPGLGAAEVLLYRLRAEGRLSWHTGPALAHASAATLHATADAVRTHLARRQVGAWQLVVLVDLPAGGHPLDGTALVDQLDRTQRHLLPPLVEAGRRPSRVTLLALDALERDHRGVPTDPAARLRWKLDTYGMARVAPEIDLLLDASQRAALSALIEAQPRLLAEDDLAAVAAAWSVLDRPEGVRLDQRITTLAPEQRATLDASRAAVLDALETALGLDDAPLPAEPVRSRFGRADACAATRARFEEDLDALTTVAAWQRFDPAATLRRAVRQTLSLDALAQQTVLLRLRLDRLPVRAQQQSLLRLTYAVAALAEVADRPPLLKPGQPYVAAVDLDDGRLVALVGAYQQRLDRVRRDVERKLDEPLVEALDLVRDPDCGCDRTLDVRGRFDTADRWSRVRPLRDTDDLRWDTWADGIAAALTSTRDEADAHIAACVRAEAARFPTPQPHRLTEPLDTLVRREGEAYRQQQRALLGSVVPPDGDGWDEAAHADAVAPRLYSRPVVRVALLWALGGVLVFALAYLAEALGSPVPFAPERAGWLGGLAVVGLLPAVGVLVGRWVALRRRWREAAHEAKEAFAGVQARYRLRTDRLAQACALRATRQRLDASLAAERAAGQRRLQLRHHAAQLQQHHRIADSLRALLEPRDASGFVDPAPPDVRLGNGLDPAKPAYANEAYHLTHRPGPPDSPARLVVNRSEHALDSPRLVGLDVLRLDHAEL